LTYVGFILNIAQNNLKTGFKSSFHLLLIQVNFMTYHSYDKLLLYIIFLTLLIQV